MTTLRAGERSAIPAGEFHRRWDALNKRLIAEGFDAYVVWGKGASALDGYADLLWVTNHYPWIPNVRVTEFFYGSGHAAAVCDLKNEPVLVCDLDDYRRDQVQVSDVRVTEDMPGTVGKVLTEMGVTSGRVALVADNAPIVGVFRRMIEQGPKVDWVSADHIIEDARLVKSAWELAAIRESARLGEESIKAILDAACRPGTTEAEAVAAGYAVAVRNGAQPMDAFVSSGPHTKYHAYGRMPGWTTRELRRGDMFAVDWSGQLDGYWWDCARTVVCGGEPSSDQSAVLDAAAAAATAAMKVMSPGAPAGDIYAAIRAELAALGMDASNARACANGPSVPPLYSAAYHGHGLGLIWETPWALEGEQQALIANTAYDIELVAGSDDIGWAKLEDEVFITDAGIEHMMNLPLRIQS